MADQTKQPERMPTEMPPLPEMPKGSLDSAQQETVYDPEIQEHQQSRQEMIAREQNTELKKEEGFLDETIGALKEKLKTKKKKTQSIPQVRDQVTLQIEQVMQDGLVDAYKELTPVQQQEFKIKGEKTAREIRELLKRSRVKIKTIFKLLVEWLKLLPGVNRFFIEQEAKIKADKILSLTRRK